MKKLLSILFAAMIGMSLSFATFAQDAPKAETKKEEAKKVHKKGTKKSKAEVEKEKKAEVEKEKKAAEPAK
jgi:Ni/Co efflux regulator RcnB